MSWKFPCGKKRVSKKKSWSGPTEASASLSRATCRLREKPLASSSNLGGPNGYLYEHGDIVFGNLEGTLTDRGDSKCGGPSGGNCFAFRARCVARLTTPTL